MMGRLRGWGAGTVALERDQWINPVSAFSINERGRQQAAEGLLEKLRESMRLRGCNEDWTPDPVKLSEGLVCSLPLPPASSLCCSLALFA